MRQYNRRIAGLAREGVADGEDEGFIDEDLRYYRVSERPREISNGVCILMIDVSGSMGWEQKYLCRAFFWLLVQFVRSKYENVETVFIIHHSTAREVDEDQFFHTRESGGTEASSAYQLALEVIANRYDPKMWNVYAFHMSDGDNWGDDNDLVVNLAEQLAKQCNLFGYGQVSGWYDNVWSAAQVSWSQLFETFEPLADEHDNIRLVRVQTKEDVYPQFRHLLEGEQTKKKGAVS